MSVKDMAAMRSAVASATQKPWDLIFFASGHSKYEYECVVVTEDYGDEIFSMNAITRLRNEVDAKNDGLDDAAYIAMFDPPTVTGLLDEIESSRNHRKTVRAAIETLLKGHQRVPSGDHRRPAGTCTGCHPGAAYPCSTRTALEPLLELVGAPE